MADGKPQPMNPHARTHPECALTPSPRTWRNHDNFPDAGVYAKIHKALREGRDPWEYKVRGTATPATPKLTPPRSPSPVAGNVESMEEPVNIFDSPVPANEQPSSQIEGDIVTIQDSPSPCVGGQSDDGGDRFHTPPKKIIKLNDSDDQPSSNKSKKSFDDYSSDTNCTSSSNERHAFLGQSGYKMKVSPVPSMSDDMTPDNKMKKIDWSKFISQDTDVTEQTSSSSGSIKFHPFFSKQYRSQ